jgi:nucleoside 2-deoxyribosyltransferase
VKTKALNICPVCKIKGYDVIRKADSIERITYKCARCGKFKITHAAERMVEKMNLGPKLSGWIRNLFESGMDIPEINTSSLMEIEQSIPDYNPSDKQYLFLRNISRKSKYPGDSVSILPDIDYPLAWASAPEEILFYIRFLVERGLLLRTGERDDSLVRGDASVSVGVTPYGWEYLEEYEQRAIELSQAYVAMPFSESMKKVWEKAIKPAINEAGYKAYRIDSKQHPNKINAKIIAEIKNSLFVVAEVTEHERVVYFEAGYAIGRNLPVIWCVRKEDLDNVHFDTRQCNHVVWKTTDELKEKLYDIICAVVGRRKKMSL